MRGVLMKTIITLLSISIFCFFSTSFGSDYLSFTKNIIIDPNQTDGVIPAGVEYYKVSSSCDEIFILGRFEENWEFVILDTIKCSKKEFLLVRLTVNKKIYLVSLSDVITFEQ